MENVHFSTIADFAEALGLPEPEHPMLFVCSKDRFESGDPRTRANPGFPRSTDFYMVAVKKQTSVPEPDRYVSSG